MLASDRRADAVAMEALIVDQPENPLIPKLARGLLDHRVKGRWNSTQENGWVLLALDRYFRTYEGVTPDFIARAWLGDGFVGESEFRGRSADRAETKVPMASLAPEPTDLVLAKDGPGRLYYRLGLRYAPDDLELEPLERGFSVTREYAAVDDPDDVKLRADGSYEIKAGARVRVRLNMVADSRRYHVALVDPLPAGLEALNPDLAVTGELPPDRPEDGPGGPEPYLRLVVAVVLVRPPGLPRRAHRGLRQYSESRRLQLHLHRPRHHPRRVRGAAGQGRGDVPSRDLRAQRDGASDRAVGDCAGF